MKSQPRKMCALALGVAVGVSALATQAEEQPTLPTFPPDSGAVFTAGATINGGASYLEMIPASDPIDVVGTIKPDPADVGKTGSLVVVIDVPGIGLFSRLSGGIWLPVNPSDLSTLSVYKVKTLEEEEPVSLLEGLVGEDANLTGLTFSAYLAYFTDGNVGTIKYSNAPAQFTISDTPTAGCPTNTSPGAGTFNGKPICVLAGGTAITSDTHLTSNNAYFLDGTVKVGTPDLTENEDKITLTIDSGTTVFANSAARTFLLIDRGARIMANGTPEAPIVFTYDEDEEGSTSVDPLFDRGKWGGVIINGRGQLNSATGFDEGEGGTGQFGGGSSPVNDDDSGSMTYVQIRYAGDVITETDELNSLALQGVGSATNIDYINVHNGADDGVEFYGGSVNARHLVLTGMDDDAIDWTLGWSGYLQHAVVKFTNSGDNCIEADTLEANNIAVPRSIPTLSNVTCIGSTDMKSSGHAMELKEGTGMKMYNSVVGGSFPQGGEGCILIRRQPTFDQSTDNGNISGLNGTLIMENSLITPACANDLQGASAAAGSDFTTTNWYNAQAMSSTGDADFGGPRAWANGWNINSVVPNIPANAFFDQVDYIGAVKDDTSDWTKGWTFDGFESD